MDSSGGVFLLKLHNAPKEYCVIQIIILFYVLNYKGNSAPIVIILFGVSIIQVGLRTSLGLECTIDPNKRSCQLFDNLLIH